ncbi:type II secretion system F family protein [Amycolatopsis keratiniphila]|uniref:type II secretion system F family protein n=1 Tax=Amycolatopsis keratiniphila TaxID=129921 RepID=UPI00087BA1C4|nr:type II secretion system F family protein [Amycolatopsis keratiniphila]OLZ59538.1 secretion system protein [Amycolatopsis keratiniphila subsp. nogabecina]SDU53725.1 Flp pilus assembly protein TadB [Amycolatopsis keratiniphila]
MIPALVFGAGTGTGLWLLLAWAAPPRPALSDQLAQVRARRPATPIVLTSDAAWVRAWGRVFVPGLRMLGLPGTTIEADLRVTGRGVDTHLASKAVLAVAGLLAPWLLQALLVLGGSSLGVEVPLLAGLGLVALGFVTPDLEVRAKATRSRREFRDALSAFLDLVWITLAGGAGVEAALGDAATVGTGPAFDKIRRALHAAQLTRTTPWNTLRRLGEELGIAELAELAASISLAGTEGARVRASLAAKAQALRTHQVTDAEADAQAATERMALPVTLLFLGFVAFIAYPAVIQVLNGL